jgi:hypothetical protein
LTFSAGGYTGVIVDLDITVEVPYGTDVSSLTAIFTNSTDSTVNATSGTIYDFTDPMEFVVTAEDGIKEKTYTVTINIMPPNTQADLLTFSAGGYNGVILSLAITMEVPYGTDVSSLVAIFTNSTGSTVNATNGTTYNFTHPVDFVVTAEDGITEKTYTVTVNILPNTEANLLTFSLGTNVGTIESLAITVEVPHGTDVTALIATFSASFGTTVRVGGVVQVSGATANNFTTSVTYVVTAADGVTSKTYIVTVIVADAPTDPTDPPAPRIDGIPPMLIFLAMSLGVFLVTRKRSAA